MSKDIPCQKSSDVKFTISTLKRNVASVSNNNVLRTENNGSDDDAEGIMDESKRQRLTLVKNGQMIEYVNFHFSNFGIGWYILRSSSQARCGRTMLPYYRSLLEFLELK